MGSNSKVRIQRILHIPFEAVSRSASSIDVTRFSPSQGAIFPDKETRQGFSSNSAALLVMYLVHTAVTFLVPESLTLAVDLKHLLGHLAANQDVAIGHVGGSGGCWYREALDDLARAVEFQHLILVLQRHQHVTIGQCVQAAVVRDRGANMETLRHGLA